MAQAGDKGIIVASRGSHRELMMIAGLAIAVTLCALVSSTNAAETRQFANGINATIYTADEILNQVKSPASGAVFEVMTPNGVVELGGERDDLVPFEFEFVAGALADMRSIGAGVDVNVYILPAVPLATGGSFARQDAIYLAPGTGTVDESTVAYITTHEMGHVLTWAFMDYHPSRWASYMELRGLDAVVNGPAAIHADRAREILAEDIRFLFGGPNATWPGSIENHYLALPDRVEGLAALLTGFFTAPGPDPTVTASSVFPNPCNPLATVVMEVPIGVLADGGGAVLRVFDIRGAHVKTVVGGRLANGRIAVQWNGTRADGTAAASGRYVYVLQVGSLVARGSLTLVR